MKVNVGVLGRLGTFGLSVMKTKADRMWEEFGHNLVTRLTAWPQAAAQVPAAPAAPLTRPLTRQGWWSRWFAPAAQTVLGAGSSGDICIEIRRPHETITVRWPQLSAAECAGCLREYLQPV